MDKDFSQGNDILILGIGNYLMGDEGVGVHFAQNLEQDRGEIPQNVSIMDGGTGGFVLIPYIENHKVVIIVDATMDGKEEGSISLLKPKFSEDFPVALSGHNFGLKDMVEILSMQDKMPEIYLYTITISKMEPMSTRLSPKVERALEKVQQLVSEKVRLLNTK